MKQPSLSHISEQLRHLAVPIASLHADTSNARKHNRKNLDAIKSSLARFGQRTPLVVQANGMVVRAGNGRLEAAKELGWTHVAVITEDDDNATAAQFAIADNRTGELADWEPDVLATLLDDLDAERRIELGFDDQDLREILEKAGRFDVEEVDAPELNDGDREPFQQMTFVLHDDQAEVIKRALQASKDMGEFVDTKNENSNGNALARMAEVFLGKC